MALAELQKRGILKYLISQNCDGLHRKSGITSVSLSQRHRSRVYFQMLNVFPSQDKISELHGNSNRESCKDCGKEYIRGASYDPINYVILLTFTRLPSCRHLRENNP
jgi:mono-ADP-ribosyltransferase sirtuin 6